MPKEVPFDAWDGEDLESTDEAEPDNAEELAMHLDPDSALVPEAVTTWSDLTAASADGVPASPVTYFADEQPDDGQGRPARVDEHEPDLEELLERQHYSFPPSP